MQKNTRLNLKLITLLQWIARALVITLVLHFSAISTFASDSNRDTESVNGPSGQPFGIPGTNVTIETNPEVVKTDLGTIESFWKSRRTRALDLLQSKLSPKSTAEIGALIDLLKFYADPSHFESAGPSKIEKLTGRAALLSIGLLLPLSYLTKDQHPNTSLVLSAVTSALGSAHIVTNAVRTQREARRNDILNIISKLLVEIHGTDAIQDLNNYQNLKKVLIENKNNLHPNFVQRLLCLFQKEDKEELIRSYPSVKIPTTTSIHFEVRAARRKYRENLRQETERRMKQELAVTPPEKDLFETTPETQDATEPELAHSCKTALK